MDRSRFDPVLSTGARTLSAASTVVISMVSKACARAEPAFRRLVHAVRLHGPPALRKAKTVIGVLVLRGQALAKETLRTASENRPRRHADPSPSGGREQNR